MPPSTAQPADAYHCSMHLAVASMVVGLVLLLMPFNIVEIVLGAQFWSSCPVERLLPIYLVFSGCLGLLLCAMCATNFAMVFGYCQRPCCTACKECRVGFTLCLAAVNCMWLACGFSFAYKADALHSSDASSLSSSTVPTDSYLYCNSNLLAFSKAALYIRMGFLACIIVFQRLMYFDLANLTQRRPIALSTKK